MGSSLDSVAWLNQQRPEALLVATMALVLLGLALWCLATWLVAHINMNAAIVMAPPLMRAALIAGLVVTISPTAHASDSPIDAVSGLELPERPSSSVDTPVVDAASDLPASPGPRRTRPQKAEPQQPVLARGAAPGAVESLTSREYHRVESGDTLWAIARARLPHSASNGEIADAVAQWHHANRHVVGTNPNLIHPGQNLKEPQS